MGDIATKEREVISPNITEREVEEALARGMIGLDAARRVGWAKAYEAMARVGALEEDVRQTRDELKVLRRAYSRLLGLVTIGWVDRGPILEAELARHFEAERLFRHDDAFDAGVAIANAHLDSLDPDREMRRKVNKFRRAIRKMLTKEARLLEHGVRTLRAPNGEKMGWYCQCGIEEMGDEANPLNHQSMVVTGLTFDDYMATLPMPTATRDKESKNVAQNDHD